MKGGFAEPQKTQSGTEGNVISSKLLNMKVRHFYLGFSSCNVQETHLVKHSPKPHRAHHQPLLLRINKVSLAEEPSQSPS